MEGGQVTKIQQNSEDRLMSASKIKRNIPKKHGISFTDLKNRTKLENGVLQHHLHYNGLFVRKKGAVMMSDACSKCELKNLCKDSCISAIISKDVKNQVLKFLNRGLTQKKMGENLNLDKATISYHVKTLRDIGALDKQDMPKDKVIEFIDLEH